MKIFAYKLHNRTPALPMATRIENIVALPLEQRNKIIDGTVVRLEEAQRIDGLWLCDFIKIRMDHGPAKGSLQQHVEGFHLAAEEGFSEETAILYDPDHEIVVAQYNHYGPRISSIEEYLSLFFHDNTAGYDFLPRYVDDIHRRLRRKGIFRRIELAIAPRLLNEGDMAAGFGLHEALSLSKSTGADNVSITISVRGRKQCLNPGVRNLLHWALQKAKGADADVINTCKVAARDNDTSPLETLDLVAARLSKEVQINPGGDKRYPRAERWVALRAVRHEWGAALWA